MISLKAVEKLSSLYTIKTPKCQCPLQYQLSANVYTIRGSSGTRVVMTYLNLIRFSVTNSGLFYGLYIYGYMVKFHAVLIT